MSDLKPPPAQGDLPPISRQDLKALFDYVDRQYPPRCTHHLTETERFLVKRGLPLLPVVEWINRSGAVCDCEFILRTGKIWGEWSGRRGKVEDGI